MLWCAFVHEVGPLAVYEGAQGQTVPPWGCEVGDVDASVALSLFLTPGQQPAGADLGLCKREIRRQRCQYSIVQQRHRDATSISVLKQQVVGKFFTCCLSVQTVTQQNTETNSSGKTNDSDTLVLWLERLESPPRPGAKSAWQPMQTQDSHATAQTGKLRKTTALALSGTKYFLYLKMIQSK